MRVDYWSLPPAVRAALTARLSGDVRSAASAPDGFSGGVAALLGLADGREVFVKGCPVGHPLAGVYEVEAWFGRRVLEDAPDFPAPALLGEVEADGWHLLAFAAVPRAHNPRLTVGTDLDACLALFSALASARYPDSVRHRIPPVSVTLGHLAHGWRNVAADPPRHLDPWAHAYLGTLCALETEWVADAAGETPAHTDLHPRNILVSPGPVGPTAVAVDWTRPSHGARWIDPLLCCLGDPGLPALPDWFRERYPLPHQALVGFLAGAAGHWTDAARHDPPDYAPGLRAYEHSRAERALTWLRTELEGFGA